MKKLVSKNQGDWHKKLHEVPWVDRITPKRDINISAFELIYSTKPSLPLPLELLVGKLHQVIEDRVLQNGLEK